MLFFVHSILKEPQEYCSVHYACPKIFSVKAVFKTVDFVNSSVPSKPSELGLGLPSHMVPRIVWDRCLQL